MEVHAVAVMSSVDGCDVASNEAEAAVVAMVTVARSGAPAVLEEHVVAGSFDAGIDDASNEAEAYLQPVGAVVSVALAGAPAVLEVPVVSVMRFEDTLCKTVVAKFDLVPACFDQADVYSTLGQAYRIAVELASGRGHTKPFIVASQWEASAR
jgi:hypothetical protein